MTLSGKKLWDAITRLSFLWLLLSVTAQAAQPASTVSPPVSSATAGGMLQVLFGLIIVLAAIAGTAWLLRRIGPGQSSAGGMLKLVGGMMVSPKERVVLVEIGETWLLLGVAAGQVNTLHTMPKPPDADLKATTENSDVAFPNWLKLAMQGKKRG
ncbi:flagellar biosynthetic protein FliO [Sulfurirhabdus autotrophica]|uniref:Flagellar protein n=1 Tax=Sulfurirhabdus autotrophica TaxID=1706046 RepID=A0A4R3YFL4_9PROT|nr:flagellar biosynthetic protein FliO [Sulfurirhabdus autotrophica]TCV90771.1 flagellar protein FliO/FliZ [Sulfurirhabdus autotrophica]